jgi:hypothetical protein
LFDCLIWIRIYLDSYSYRLSLSSSLSELFGTAFQIWDLVRALTNPQSILPGIPH